MLRPPIDSPGARLRELMREDVVLIPGVFNAVSALSACRAGAKALYMSGAGITNAALGVPDIALATLTEFAQEARRISAVSSVPIVSDADTGFGEALNVARAIVELEGAGLAGVHLEDQVSPKRCGHLDGKSCVPSEQMAAKLRAAVSYRRDPSFLIIARTDARSVEGLESAIDRSKLYVDAGADAVFPEGLESEKEFESFRRAVDVPLLANMTEFGKTPVIPLSRFRDLGYQMVIFPMTAFRLMLKALDEGYAELIETGTQAGMLGRMRTRADLYELLEYAEYERRDLEWSGG